MHSDAMVSVVSGAVSQPDYLENHRSTVLPRWDGLVFGDVHLFLAQLAGIGITIAIAVVGTLVCIGIVRIFTKIRVDDRSETIGLDLSEHGEKAYPSFNGWD